MKIFNIFSFSVILSIIIFSCKNDQEDFGPMKGVNYLSRHDAFGAQLIYFENAVGLLDDSLKKSARLTVAPNTFVNEDGTAYNGKVVMTINGDYVRGWWALHSIPTTSNGNTLLSEGAVYLNAADMNGNNLKISLGKNITISIPGGVTATQNNMYYGDDNVQDPSPANTSLFDWKETTTDIVESYFDSNTSLFFYTLKPTQLGWVSCSRLAAAPTNPVGIKVRVLEINPIFATNTAVYVVPVNGKSAYRLWNYDKPTNTFSMDKPYLENGTNVYIIVIAYVRHFKIYYVKDDCIVNGNTFKVVNASENKLNTIITNLYYL